MSNYLNDEQRSLYLDMTEDLDSKGTQDFMVKMKTVLESGAFMAMVDIEKCDRPSNVVSELKRLGKVKLSKNNVDLTELIKVLERMHEIELKGRIENYERKMNAHSDPSTPLTCLYNKSAVLPAERLDEFLDILKNFIESGPDAIPQQLFYTNAASGIARPDKGLSLHLEKSFSVTVMKGSVTENKIIYCHFTEGAKPCLLADGCPLECYSVPVLLGPAGEHFRHPVLLQIAHNAECSVCGTLPLKYYTRQENERSWQEAEQSVDATECANVATVFLPHFSEFVIGVASRSTSNLPPLRSRFVTSVISNSKDGCILVLCIAFDCEYMMQKIHNLLHAKSGRLSPVTSSQEIQLQPRTAIQTKVEAGRWATDDSIHDITPEELSTLVFKPVVREIKMVRKQDLCSEIMCRISIAQKDQNLKFVVLENTFKQTRNTEQQLELENSHITPYAQILLKGKEDEIKSLKKELSELKKLATDRERELVLEEQGQARGVEGAEGGTGDIQRYEVPATMKGQELAHLTKGPREIERCRELFIKVYGKDIRRITNLGNRFAVAYGPHWSKIEGVDICNISSGVKQGTIDAHAESVRYLAVTPDKGTLVAFCCDEAFYGPYTIRLYDPETGRCIGSTPQFSVDGGVEGFDVCDGRQFVILHGHYNKVTIVGEDGSVVLTEKVKSESFRLSCGGRYVYISCGHDYVDVYVITEDRHLKHIAKSQRFDDSGLRDVSATAADEVTVTCKRGGRWCLGRATFKDNKFSGWKYKDVDSRDQWLVSVGGDYVVVTGFDNHHKRRLLRVFKEEV